MLNKTLFPLNIALTAERWLLKLFNLIWSEFLNFIFMQTYTPAIVYNSFG